MEALDLIIEYPNAFPDDLCDEIIRRVDQDSRLKPGFSGIFGPDETTNKISDDLCISDIDGWYDIDKQLCDIISPYISNYAQFLVDTFFFDEMFCIKDLGYQIQKTKPGGFFNWHNDQAIEIFDDLKYRNEFAGSIYPIRDRIFTYILYLNDRYEYEDGKTQFKFGNKYKTITPERGKLILFPANPLYPHRGVPLENGVKYLMTGWVVRYTIISSILQPEDLQERRNLFGNPDIVTEVDT
jgi:hypothetical protein